jgi:hypothetical protein
MSRCVCWVGLLALGVSVLGGCAAKRLAQVARDAKASAQRPREASRTGSTVTIQDGETRIRIVDTEAATAAIYEHPDKESWGPVDLTEETGPVYTAEEWTAAGGRVHPVTTQDVGVPLYPGAWIVYSVRHKHTGALELQLQTTGSYEKVAEFYRDYYRNPGWFRHSMHMGPHRTATVAVGDKDDSAGLTIMQDPAGKGTYISVVRATRG